MTVRTAAPRDAIAIDVGGRSVRVTHPDRVVWPATGTTKAELVGYLIDVAPVLLPNLRDRATMLWRFPEGVDGPGWFQAQCRSRPAWVATHRVAGARGAALDYCVIDEPATLVWLANLGTIELHPHGWLTTDPATPTAVVFDLDPGPPASIREAAGVALDVADVLRRDGLTPVVKTSGGLGLHVAAPIVPGPAFGDAKAYARAVAEALTAKRPGAVIDRSDRAARRGRVYVDWIQNDRNRQLIAAYSPRATPIPNVSTPLAWDEVDGLATGVIREIRPTFAEVVDRIATVGDLWMTAGTPRAPLPRSLPRA